MLIAIFNIYYNRIHVLLIISRTGAKIITHKNNYQCNSYYILLLYLKWQEWKIKCSTYNGDHIQRQFAKTNCKLKKSLNVAETPGGNVGNESFRSSHVCSSTHTW